MVRHAIILACIVVGITLFVAYVVIEWHDKRRAQRKRDDILARYDAELEFPDDPDWARKLSRDEWDTDLDRAQRKADALDQHRNGE